MATIDVKEVSKSDNVWADSLGNKLTYLPWIDQPTWEYTGSYALMDSRYNTGMRDVVGHFGAHTICVKCSKYYSIPRRVQQNSLTYFSFNDLCAASFRL